MPTAYNSFDYGESIKEAFSPINMLAKGIMERSIYERNLKDAIAKEERDREFTRTMATENRNFQADQAALDRTLRREESAEDRKLRRELQDEATKLDRERMVLDEKLRNADRDSREWAMISGQIHDLEMQRAQNKSRMDELKQQFELNKELTGLRTKEELTNKAMSMGVKVGKDDSPESIREKIVSHVGDMNRQFNDSMYQINTARDAKYNEAFGLLNQIASDKQEGNGEVMKAMREALMDPANTKGIDAKTLQGLQNYADGKPGGLSLSQVNQDKVKNLRESMLGIFQRYAESKTGFQDPKTQALMERYKIAIGQAGELGKQSFKMMSDAQSNGTPIDADNIRMAFSTPAAIAETKVTGGSTLDRARAFGAAINPTSNQAAPGRDGRPAGGNFASPQTSSERLPTGPAFMAVEGIKNMGSQAFGMLPTSKTVDVASSMEVKPFVDLAKSFYSGSDDYTQGIKNAYEAGKRNLGRILPQSSNSPYKKKMEDLQAYVDQQNAVENQSPVIQQDQSRNFTDIQRSTDQLLGVAKQITGFQDDEVLNEFGMYVMDRGGYNQDSAAKLLIRAANEDTDALNTIGRFRNEFIRIKNSVRQ